MNRQPPVAEVFLAGLITDSESQDAILGDLHEEWNVRTTRDGSMAARFWYWGQAVQTIPHLLWAWCRTATLSEVGMTAAVSLIAAQSLIGTLALPGTLLAFSSEPVNRVLLWALSLAIAAVSGTIAGAGVASVARRGPMFGVIVTAAVFLSAISLVWPRFPSILSATGIPMDILGQAIVVCIGIGVGGILASEKQAGRLKISAT